MTCPAYITARRSEKWLTRDMSWVTKRTANPSRRWRSLIWSISDRWATTSSAEVGSSMITSSGVKRRAMAIIARWRMPPLSWWGKLLRWTASMPTSRITSADRSWIFWDVRLSCAWSASRS